MGMRFAEKVCVTEKQNAQRTKERVVDSSNNMLSFYLSIYLLQCFAKKKQSHYVERADRKTIKLADLLLRKIKIGLSSYVYRAEPRSRSVICVRQTALIFPLLFKFLPKHRGKTFDRRGKKLGRSCV